MVMKRRTDLRVLTRSALVNGSSSFFPDEGENQPLKKLMTISSQNKTDE